MTWWEYCILEADTQFAGQGDRPEGALDYLGAQGWELVAIAADGRMYMKRPGGST